MGLLITSSYKTCAVLVILLLLIRLKFSKNLLQKQKLNDNELLLIAIVFGILGIITTYLPQEDIYGTTIATLRVIIVSGGILFGGKVGIIASIINVVHLPLIDRGCVAIIPEMMGILTAGIIASLVHNIIKKYKIKESMIWIIGILTGVFVQYISYIEIQTYFAIYSVPPFTYSERLTIIHIAMTLAQLPIGIFILVIQDIANEKKISGMEKLEWELNKVKLSMLQSQINPHFLFNTLNVIGLLTSTEPNKARDTIVQLSKYIRHNLELQGEFISIQEEMEQVKCYIDIQKIRFEGDFNVIYNIDNSISTKIPSLIIQPLVENALEHGILKSGQVGNIYILVQKEDERIYVAIENTGIPIDQSVIDNLDKETINSSIGLRNVHTRLKMIYGKGLIIHRLNNGTKIEFYVGGEYEGYNNRG